MVVSVFIATTINSCYIKLSCIERQKQKDNWVSLTKLSGIEEGKMTGAKDLLLLFLWQLNILPRQIIQLAWKWVGEPGLTSPHLTARLVRTRRNLTTAEAVKGASHVASNTMHCNAASPVQEPTELKGDGKSVRKSISWLDLSRLDLSPLSNLKTGPVCTVCTIRECDKFDNCTLSHNNHTFDLLLLCMLILFMPWGRYEYVCRL